MDRKSGLLGLGAAAMFTAMVVGEFAQEDAFALWDAAFDLLNMALMVGTVLASVLLALRLQAQEERGDALARELAGVHAQAEQWRIAAAGPVRELALAIQAQFRTWGLTPSEQEVALLLLKGFSHKEIARLRQIAEATVRQQAAAVYLKSGLSGRAGLSAFFLEALMLPQATPGWAAQYLGS